MDTDNKVKSKDEEDEREACNESVPFWQIAPAIEFVCCVVLVLAPMLRLINGAPVTDDQASIQISMVLIAIVGAVILRIYNRNNKENWAELLQKSEVVASAKNKGRADG